MKKIRINDGNATKIEMMLSEIQDKCSARVIHYADIVKMIGIIEEHYNIPKKAFDGSIFDIDKHAQDKPRAYKYRMESTQFKVGYSGGSWQLLSIERWETRRSSQTIQAELSDTTKLALLDRFSVMEVSGNSIYEKKRCSKW